MFDTLSGLTAKETATSLLRQPVVLTPWWPHWDACLSLLRFARVTRIVAALVADRHLPEQRSDVISGGQHV
jgi:hypothetical protein